MAEIRLIPSEQLTTPELIEGAVAFGLLAGALLVATSSPAAGVMMGIAGVVLLVNQAFELGFVRL